MERVRWAVQAKAPVTISIGLATSNLSDVSVETLLREADRALYRSKRAGKNKVSQVAIVSKGIAPIDCD